MRFPGFTASLLMLSVLCSTKSMAEPLVISFPEMIEQSKTIVVANYLGSLETNPFGGPHQLLVSQVLKGEIKQDTLSVSTAASYLSLKAGDRIVAFMDKDGTFRWVGRFKGKDQQDNSLIFLEGFYDYNAYMVTYNLITLPQLKDYLDHQSFSGQVRGALHFLDPVKRKMKASDLEISISYTYKDDGMKTKISAPGIGSPKDNSTPGFWLGGRHMEAGLVWEGNYRKGHKAIELRASLWPELSPEGEIIGLFYLEEPEELSREQFDRFRTDPTLGTPYYEVGVISADGDTAILLLNQHSGRIGTLSSPDGKVLSCSSASDPTTTEDGEYLFGDNKEIELVIPATRLGANTAAYSREDLIQCLRMRPLKATMIDHISSEGTQEIACTLVLLKTHFRKR